MLSATTARCPARARARCSSTCRRSRPATARSLAERLRGEGHAFVDAPVTGSSPKAEAGHADDHGAAAPTADIERARPLFEVMGEKIVPPARPARARR